MAKAIQSSAKHFVFRKHANIGAADAIEDKKFLTQSFFDSGELAILCDIERPECIVTGRTGSGKTALLEQLGEIKDRVIKITPEGLALTYVSSNETLNFFSAAGVDLDLFYRLLWRHVFAVEIIREHYHIVNERSRDDFLTKIRDKFSRNRSRRDAIAYLLKWGESFWQESEYRVVEVTKKLEQELGTAIGGTVDGSLGVVKGGMSLNAEAAKKLSQEEKAEIIRRGQSVVDKVQMKTLSDIMDILEKDILDDKQKVYYITIDRLDENWVNDDLRYHLIRALMETVRDFNGKIRNVKIIVAIREDLLDRVFRYTRSSGYQEEKYKSMYLPITWKQRELEELLDRRVNQLVKEQYTSREPSLRDLLAKTIFKQETIPYLMERTMYRPRDIIMFFNECIRAAEGKPFISQTMVLQAEVIYSESRLRALADEWSADYPNLIELALFLKKCPRYFMWKEACENIEEKMLNFLVTPKKEDYIYTLMKEKFDADDIDGFMQEMFLILFRTGVIGIKQESYTRASWSYLGQKLLGSEISRNAMFHIHPAFWSVLGSRPLT